VAFGNSIGRNCRPISAEGTKGQGGELAGSPPIAKAPPLPAQHQPAPPRLDHGLQLVVEERRSAGPIPLRHLRHQLATSFTDAACEACTIVAQTNRSRDRL